MAIRASLSRIRTKIWHSLLKHSRCYCPNNATQPRSLLTWLADTSLALGENFYRWHFWRFKRLMARLPRKAQQTDPGVLMVTRSLNPCGSIRQAVLLLHELARHANQLICLLVLHLDSERNRFYLPTLLSQNIQVETLQPTYREKDANAIRCLPANLRDLQDILDPISRHRPSVLHAWQDGTNIKIGLAGMILGVPRIVLSTSNVPPCHFLFYRPYMRAAYRYLSQQPHVTIVNNSEYGARAYERWLKLPAGTVQVIRNSIDFDPSQLAHAMQNREEYRRQIPIPANGLLVGSVMRLTEEKRPLLWLDIAARIHQRDPNIHFLVIGDGPLKNTLREAIEQRGLTQVVHLMYEEKRLVNAVAALDLLLLTSRTTGLANVVIEAQAVNVPVVMTQAGGALEAIIPDQTGWEIPADDPEEAAMLVMRILQDDVLRARVAQVGPAFVQQQFSVQRLYQQYAQLYR